jgi:hypothetical protein
MILVLIYYGLVLFLIVIKNYIVKDWKGRSLILLHTLKITSLFILVVTLLTDWHYSLILEELSFLFNFFRNFNYLWIALCRDMVIY